MIGLLHFRLQRDCLYSGISSREDETVIPPWIEPQNFLSMRPHHTSWRPNLLLLSHLRPGLPSGTFPSVSSPKLYRHTSCLHYLPHASPNVGSTWRKDVFYYKHASVHLIITGVYKCASVSKVLRADQWTRSKYTFEILKGKNRNSF